MAERALAKSFLIDKKLKAIAVDGQRRWSIIPDVPTLTEAVLAMPALQTGLASPRRPVTRSANHQHAERGLCGRRARSRTEAQGRGSWPCGRDQHAGLNWGD